jgi:tetratricopeptide (TPR) repeat protein
MRKFFLITSTIIPLLSFSFVDAQSPKELFEQANKLYKSEKFERALELYKKIPNKSVYVNYNLGNCAYKLERYGYALLYWRRAEKNWGVFNREELVSNIFLVKEKLTQMRGITRTKRNPIVKKIVKIKNIGISLLRSMPIFVLQILFLIIWIFLFIYIRFLYKKRKKQTISILFSLIAIFGVLLVVRYTIDSRRYGIVVTKTAPLRSGPGITFQTLLNIPEGTELVIKRKMNGSYKVKALGQIGYVQKGDLEKI